MSTDSQHRFLPITRNCLRLVFAMLMIFKIVSTGRFGRSEEIFLTAVRADAFQRNVEEVEVRPARNYDICNHHRAAATGCAC